MTVAVPRARVAVAIAVVALAAAARAQEEAPAQDSSHDPRRFGIGWQVGNGLGYRGAAVIVAPWRRLGFELQVSQLDTDVQGASRTDETASGWGLAPLVRAYPGVFATTEKLRRALDAWGRAPVVSQLGGTAQIRTGE